MMNKARLSFFIGLVFMFLQVGCSTKIAPVSGAAGLSGGESQGSVEDLPNAMDDGAVAEQDMISGFFEDAPRGMESLRDESPKDRDLLSGTLDGREDQSVSNTDVIRNLEDIYFEYDKAVLQKGSKEALQENARHLVLHPNTSVQIEGHTDERGNNEYNLALGARRARAVKRFLEALGVEPNRMKIISFGEEKPFCRVRAESCWKQNRRAHFMTQPEG